MPLTASLEQAAITLPLDIVLGLLKASRGKLDEETEALLKIEVASVLCEIESLEDEVVGAILRDAFGGT